MYIYQNNNRYFAQAADDIKDLVISELEGFGATELKPGYRGVYFTASPETLYEANFRSVLINRILAPLLRFDCHSDKYLYKTASNIEWQDFMDVDQTFAVFATVTHSNIRHSKYAALRVKDAIVDYFRDRTGRRPSIDTHTPDVWFNLYIENNVARLSLDTSGGSLHRRGYRVQSVAAPMAETLAASIIRLSGWDAQTPLYDPFCGSGTLLCEAWLYATGTPAAFMRNKFGFQRLPDFNREKWLAVKKKILGAIKQPAPGLISGSDILAEAVEAAKQNVNKLNAASHISITKNDFFKLPELENRVIVCNPPYGIRLNKKKDLSDFYTDLGDFLKQRCKGSVAYIYFGERKYIKRIGLRTDWKKPLTNGGLDGRLVKFDLY